MTAGLCVDQCRPVTIDRVDCINHSVSPLVSFDQFHGIDNEYLKSQVQLCCAVFYASYEHCRIIHWSIGSAAMEALPTAPKARSSALFAEPSGESVESGTLMAEPSRLSGDYIMSIAESSRLLGDSQHARRLRDRALGTSQA